MTIQAELHEAQAADLKAARDALIDQLEAEQAFAASDAQKATAEKEALAAEVEAQKARVAGQSETIEQLEAKAASDAENLTENLRVIDKLKATAKSDAEVHKSLVAEREKKIAALMEAATRAAEAHEKKIAALMEAAARAAEQAPVVATAGTTTAAATAATTATTAAVVTTATAAAVVMPTKAEGQGAHVVDMNAAAASELTIASLRAQAESDRAAIAERDERIQSLQEAMRMSISTDASNILVENARLNGLVRQAVKALSQTTHRHGGASSP